MKAGLSSGSWHLTRLVRTLEDLQRCKLVTRAGQEAQQHVKRGLAEEERPPDALSVEEESSRSMRGRHEVPLTSYLCWLGDA
eukprot:755829-Hanusia_phi.AAC.1